MDVLKGKWALVTGSSRGIGQQTSFALARCGCNMAIHARANKNAADTMEQISGFGVDAFSIGADLGVTAELEELIETIISRIGGVDILYNNAAVMPPWRESCDFSIEEWQTIFNVNVFAAARLCSAFIPIMKERGYGRIINVSSGIENTPQLVPYGASKWAIDKLTEELAHGLKGTNVLVNSIDPGWIKTDMGGENAENGIETVLPGMLIPALLQDKGPSGRKFQAQDFKYLRDLKYDETQTE